MSGRARIGTQVFLSTKLEHLAIIGSLRVKGTFNQSKLEKGNVFSPFLGVAYYEV